MSKIIHAPNSIKDAVGVKIFLAGTIEMGKSEDWQTKFYNKFHLADPYDLCTFFNPRRPDWDDSWEQSIENEKFKQQVEWELHGLTHSTFIVMNFLPETKSPISLLELGLFCGSFGNNKMFVCCPKGYWKKGNVDIVCERYSAPQFENLDILFDHLKAEIKLKLQSYSFRDFTHITIE